MAIQPVELFQQQPGTSLVQILQGGNAQLSHILDQAIQIGRDVANKRTAQEQDMLAMRQQETNIAQRRAEDLQQNIEDAQKFAFTRSDTDRKFNAAMQQQGWAQDRTTAQDLFGNQQTEARLDLAQQENARQDTELGMRKDAFAQEQSQRQAVADYAQSGGEKKTKSMWEGVKNLFGGNRDEQIKDMTSLESRATAAKQSGNPALAADLFGEARVLEDKLNRKRASATRTTKTPNPIAEETAQIRLENLKQGQQDRLEADAQKEFHRMVGVNKGAFNPETEKLHELTVKKKAGTITAEEQQKLQILENYNAAPGEYELAYVKDYINSPTGRNEWIKAGGLDPNKTGDKNVRIRGEFFDKAKVFYQGRSTRSTGPQDLGPPPTKGPAADFYKPNTP